jgi:Zn-finger nucleic acid-binding protein
MTSTTQLTCPKCAGEMVTYERSGIHLDQCRECRGFFLDRGELEKLVDAEGGAWVGPQPGVPAQAVHAAPAPVPPAGYPGMPQGYPMSQGYPGVPQGYPMPAPQGYPTSAPQGRSDQSQNARYGDRDRGGDRSKWDDDREDRDDRRGFDPRGFDPRGFDPRGSSGRPSKKKSLISDLLEGFGE